MMKGQNGLVQLLVGFAFAVSGWPPGCGFLFVHPGGARGLFVAMRPVRQPDRLL